MIQSTFAAILDVRTPPLAPLVLLAFLGTGAAVAVSAVGGAIALAARRFGLAKVFLAGGLIVPVAYGAVLAAVALFSRERILKVGERKYFCEMDCHIAYAVVAAESPRDGVRSVTVRTWFDPTTVAAFRGNAPLSPNPRVAYLVDASGRRYQPSADATKALSRGLSPGDSYETTLAFDVPPGPSHLRLFLGDAPGLESLLIGHESSPLHGKAYFELPGTSAAPGVPHS